jgi:hypothetical protein
VILVGCALDTHAPPPPSVPVDVPAMPSPGSRWPTRVEPPVDAAPSEMPLEIAPIFGQLGDVEFDDIPYRIAADTAPAWDYVALFVEGGVVEGGVVEGGADESGVSDRLGGVAMAALVIDGGLGHPALVPGFARTFTSGVAIDGGAIDDLQIGTLGCSGPMEAAWSFDRFADQTTIIVSNGPTPEQRTIEFVAEYLTEGQTVQGSFSYTVATDDSGPLD